MTDVCGLILTRKSAKAVDSFGKRERWARGRLTK